MKNKVRVSINFLTCVIIGTVVFDFLIVFCGFIFIGVIKFDDLPKIFTSPVIHIVSFVIASAMWFTSEKGTDKNSNSD